MRAQKFAFKAGLTFRITQNAARNFGTSTDADYTVIAFRYQRVDNTDPTSDLVFDGNGDPIEIPLNSIPLNVIGGATITGNGFSGIDPTKDASDPAANHVDGYATDGTGDNNVIGGMLDKRVEQ